MKIKYKYKGIPSWNKGMIEIRIIAENNKDKEFINFYQQLYEDINGYQETNFDNDNEIIINS